MASPIVGKVYEVVLQTDEAYYPVGLFHDEDEAARIMTQGNAALWEDKYIRFEVRSRGVIANTGDWSADDFKEAISDYLGDYGEDYFRTERR